ncbi:MAG: pyridoxamine 5'-phosphate oxidase family protein [Candidatus Omnitrophota bacterium]
MIDEIKEIIKDAGLGYLATIEANEPRVRPLMPALFNDGTILAATQKGSPKLLQFEKNNNFEICFVDRKLSQLRIRGKASISTDIKKKEWLSNAVPMLRSYFPTADDPNYTLVELKPEKILLIHVGEQDYTEVPVA